MSAAIEVTVEFPLRIVIYPAPDLKGQWIAHGLETDVVTQGDSPEHAIEMMGDAMKTLIDYSTRRHLTGRQGLPFILRPAPREVWDLIGESVPSGLIARDDRAREHKGRPERLAALLVRQRQTASLRGCRLDTRGSAVG